MRVRERERDRDRKRQGEEREKGTAREPWWCPGGAQVVLWR